jgi:hypothetical protein
MQQLITVLKSLSQKLDTIQNAIGILGTNLVECYRKIEV